MKQITIRNVTPDLEKALRKEQHRRATTLNQIVLDLLKKALGMESAGGFNNGLGKLAGTWSEEEFQEFDKNVEIFEQIDEELWK